MDIEQPALANIGVEAAHIGFEWTWELGWCVTSSRRLSGSERWSKRSYPGCSADEARQLAGDIVAEWLGLV